MFNREVRMQIVKTKKTTAPAEEAPKTNSWTATDIANVVVSTTERLGRAALAGAVIIIAAKTASEIAINAAPKRH